MVLETLVEYTELISILVAVLLAVATWFFRSKANAMEKYVAANRASQEFITAVMVALEDLVITDAEASEIKERCAVMVKAIAEFIGALSNEGKDTEVALEESVRAIMAR